MLQIKPDIFTFTSDHFELILQKCEQLLRSGRAYVDDTAPEIMKSEREQRIESKNRNNSVEKNISMWEEMKKGSDFGQKCCVRAKIDMNSDNGCLRDPAMFRCKNQKHPRTQFKYKVYPTYDFACPIVDSIEGITHALRTSEYLDRDAQFYWFIDALGLRKPYICAYSRLNMMNTVLSKRKLTYFVEEGIVDGWDDPRMPTVRGVIRRGLTVEGLKQFIVAQGSSRSVVIMDWDKIWAFNKKVIDPIAPRYSAVEKSNSVIVNISDDITGTLEVSLHPKNAELGKRLINIGKQVLIDQTDAQLINISDNVTFINWGNLLITNIIKDPKTGLITNISAQLNLENKDFKKTLKVTWIELSSSIPAVFTYFDHIIQKPVLGKDDDFKKFIGKNTRLDVEVLADNALKNLKKGDIIQIQRKGFFICDSVYDESTVRFSGKAAPVMLISIPDGSTDINIFPKVVQEWKKKNQQIANNENCDSIDLNQLNLQIKECGDKVRQLKANKESKEVINESVQKLLSLKERFKKASGKDWTPNIEFNDSKAPALTNDNKIVVENEAQTLDNKIKEKGDLIRKLKAEKADKDLVQENVKQLLALKEEYKKLTASDWSPNSSTVTTKLSAKPAANNKKDKSPVVTNKKSESIKAKTTKEVEQTLGKSSSKKQTRLGIEVKKNENSAEWYTEVITKAEMIEYYDVSGCYILRPWAYAIWETIQSYFDDKIKKIGVENCYFPMFISKSALETEKTHIADFAPEVAWVTKSGQSELAEPIAIRPTSETVMYPSYAKWVQSHRDLPIKLNQWCSVVRWEFKTPTPFLRTREFLWQEGHSAFATQEEALEEVYTILDYYAEVYEYLLAIPVIKGRKTEKEKFAGGEMTTTCEAYVGTNGRGIQGATSHFLGQNFSKMFEIVFEDPQEIGQKRFAFQNSWGLSTRSIGAVVMIHGDDKGMVLPPRVAAIQVIIVPCGITANTTDEDKNKLIDGCKQLEKTLKSGGIKAKCDLSDHYSPGWKFNHWELKGVPIRIEFGPKDMQKGEYVAVRRDNGLKSNYKLANASKDCQQLLDEIHEYLYNKSKEERDSHLTVTQDWNEFILKLDQKFIIMAPFCGEISCEDKIKKDSAKEDSVDSSGPLMGAKSLCIPLEQPKPITNDMKCIYPNCKTNPKFFTLFGRSY
jgi:bifunctional glutamyl/prolyl-tRNA synthetase